VVVLGVMSSKKRELDDKAEIIARLNEAAKYCPKGLLSYFSFFFFFKLILLMLFYRFGSIVSFSPMRIQLDSGRKRAV
jgi:hypothetical protein